MKNGKYVYCFIDGKVTQPVELMGIGNNEKVYFISYQDVTAALSDTPYRIYDPSRSNALTHESIIQHLMKLYNVVPCSFGNVFKSREDVMTFMEKAYIYIRKNLDKVRGKMEVGLRAFWKKEAFSQEIETREILDFRSRLLKKNDAENYYAKIELGKKVEAQVNLRREFYKRNIYEVIAKQASEAVANEPNHPMMVLNAAFLIPSSREKEFDAFVEAVLKKYSERLEFSYSGPWPPYNFIHMDL